MKATSGHLILSDDVQYSDLNEVFPEILTTFLEETGQMPEDDDVLKMFIHLNQAELERNQKPEGYNRKGRMRLVFPLDSKEFYIRGNSKSNEVVRISEKISRMLKGASIEHELEWNRLYMSE
jgi:hypothetical protein